MSRWRKSILVAAFLVAILNNPCRMLGQFTSNPSDESFRSPTGNPGTITPKQRDDELKSLLEHARQAHPEIAEEHTVPGAGGTANNPPLTISGLIPAEVPPELKSSYHELMKAQIDHEVWALKQRQKIYAWQFWAGIMVFVVSIGIVILGMYMSWLQFDAFYRHSMSSQVGSSTSVDSASQTVTTVTQLAQSAATAGTAVTPAPRPSTPADGPPGGIVQREINQIELSSAGVKIATPIVGIIILTLSLAFFYLYLAFVFQIK